MQEADRDYFGFVLTGRMQGEMCIRDSLYGDAEVTFNEDGGRETVLMKYPNGKVYRQLEYDYNNYYSGDVNLSLIHI